MTFPLKPTIYTGTEEGTRSITCNVSAMLLGAMRLLLQIAAVGAAELLPDFDFRGGEKEMPGGIRWGWAFQKYIWLVDLDMVHLRAFLFHLFYSFWGLMTRLTAKNFGGVETILYSHGW